LAKLVGSDEAANEPGRTSGSYALRGGVVRKKGKPQGGANSLTNRVKYLAA